MVRKWDTVPAPHRLRCGHLVFLTDVLHATQVGRRMSKFNKTWGGFLPPGPSDSIIPPPRSQDDLWPHRPPRGQRTPSLGQELPEFEELPEDAAPWMKRARRLVLALEHAITGGDLGPGELAALERAWSAYELGVSDANIAAVAHLCERAHGALNQKFKGSPQEAYKACAAVLHSGLPRGVRKHIDEPEVIEIVRVMRSEPDPWPAVVDATAKILRWDAQARQHAGRAIRVALSAQKP